MFKSRVLNPQDALAYVTDCTLATVSDMASKKSSPKGEFGRQVGIAQQAIEWMLEFEVDFSNTRAADVVKNHDGSVAAWAEIFAPPSQGRGN